MLNKLKQKEQDLIGAIVSLLTNSN